MLRLKLNTVSPIANTHSSAWLATPLLSNLLFFVVSNGSFKVSATLLKSNFQQNQTSQILETCEVLSVKLQIELHEFWGGFLARRLLPPR